MDFPIMTRLLTTTTADTSNLPTNLASWGLPELVVTAYNNAGVANLFPWQSQCLNTGKALQGGNLVYSAPTSAGKTLVSEIILLKRVMETNRKGLFILPFISLAREKMLSLQKIFKGTGIRIGGFMGNVHPPGGLAVMDIGICTIERANSLVNKMIRDKELDQLGVIVVDELHLVGDPSRGFLIELLLTKVEFFNKTHAARNETTETDEAKSKAVQIVGMSATLPNLNVVAKWLNADLYITDYRPVPLYERVQVGSTIYDKTWRRFRPAPRVVGLKNDPDHIVSLCFETVQAGHSVLLFCPYKAWCENMADVIMKGFSSLFNSPIGPFFNRELCQGVLMQLRSSPVGVDRQLERTVPFAVAFHHAGLSMDERDIIEAAFRRGHIRVLIATTTLSAGVNLPARRVIIRSPMFNSSLMDVLTYNQMAGRAGRKGVDSEGESILICKETEQKNVMSGLFGSPLSPVKSCLGSLSVDSVSPVMVRAVLEIIGNNSATCLDDIVKYLNCTLFSCVMEPGYSSSLAQKIVDKLKEKELIGAMDDGRIWPSQLGSAVVWSGLSPGEGSTVFTELDKARVHVNLETELHTLYLVIPLNIIREVTSVDWYHYMKLWERLPLASKRVGELVGVHEQILAMAVRGKTPCDSDLVCLRRFYCALILNELVNEVPLPTVSDKYQVSKGTLQSLQQGSSTYAGMVTRFCQELHWEGMRALMDQFQNRLLFGVQRDLVELMKIEYLTVRQARLLHQAGYTTIATLATAERPAIRTLLVMTSPFNMSNKTSGGSKVLLNGMEAVEEDTAAEIVITEARRLLQRESEALGFHLVEAKKKPGPSLDRENIPVAGGSRKAKRRRKSADDLNRRIVGRGIKRRNTAMVT